jgi:hypothetical protein
MRRVHEYHESLRQVATDYGVSRETVRRLLRTSGEKRAGDEAVLLSSSSAGRAQRDPSCMFKWGQRETVL